LHQRGQIRCPFGCRAQCRGARARRRSEAYYKSQRGKEAKKKLNQRRCRLPPRQAGPGPATAPPKGPRRRLKPGAVKKRSVRSNSVILQHVRMVVSLIEGRRVSRRQVQLMLAKILRQHTLTRRKQIDQTVLWLHKHPPCPEGAAPRSPQHGKRSGTGQFGSAL